MEKKHSWIKNFRNIINFILLTSILFVALLLISNWSAYSAFARAIISPEALLEEKAAMEGGLANTEIDGQDRSAKDAREERRKRIAQKNISVSAMPSLGAEYFDQDINHVSLSVSIAPYEDRIIIPKIGKNIPLVDVEHHDASNSNEWHKIFMKELEK